MIRALALAALVSCVAAAPAADEVTSLPGWEGPLPSKHYSGYVSAGGSCHMHYYFVEAQDVDPASAPVVLWLQGGPCGSSLFGMFTELGPFNLNQDSLAKNVNGAPQLFKSPTAWSKVANMIFFESPATVGFSYCDTTTPFNDSSTATGNMVALEGFFTKFPEFSSNDFYISGESYAGIYVPTLAADIVNKGDTGINLKGIVYGNGCTGTTVGTCGTGGEFYSIKQMAYKNMFSPALWDAIQKACTSIQNPSAECQKLVLEAQAEAGSFNIYNVYDSCGNDQVSVSQAVNPWAARQYTSTGFGTAGHPHIREAAALGALGDDSTDDNAGNPSGLNGYKCGGETALGKYLAVPAVAEAMHIPAGRNQQSCNYTPTNPSVLPDISMLVRHIRVLTYSGDVDACVPITDTDEWTRSLGFPVIKEWHPWTITDPVRGSYRGGYAVDYKVESGYFQFVSIKGAGHMTPRFQPTESLEMFSRFLKGEHF